jgi:Fic family protein
MFPVLPSRVPPELEALALDVARLAPTLGKGLHPLVLEELARLMAKVNSYYTNAMEGNPSRLADIDKALARNFSKDAAARNYQREHVAHVEVQRLMLERLKAEPDAKICSEEFLCWLHAEFYRRLPEEMRFALTRSGNRVPVVPGELRDRGVSVGRHDAAHETREAVRAALAKFEESLAPERLTGIARILGMASSHHRFLWIHPFPDGNGRVARLLSIAYARKIGLGGDELWTVTRAFARRRGDYDARLEWADQERRNDLDGRGPLSEEQLIKFCAFYLECCKDQIQYMDDLLELKDLSARYARWLAMREDISKSGAKVMRRVLALGEVSRGEVKEIAGVKQRRATLIVRELLDGGFARSESAYGALRLNLTAEAATALFFGLA